MYTVRFSSHQVEGSPWSIGNALGDVRWPRHHYCVNVPWTSGLKSCIFAFPCNLCQMRFRYDNEEGCAVVGCLTQFLPNQRRDSKEVVGRYRRHLQRL
jgi:hypothetical protein